MINNMNSKMTTNSQLSTTEPNKQNRDKQSLHKQVQEAQRVPNMIDPKKITPRHIIIKMPIVKDKERI